MKAREDADGFAIGFDDGGGDVFTGAILSEKFEERGVAEVFFKISAMVQVFGVDFRHGQAVAAKMLRKFEEGGIFFATAVENANGADALIGKADNLPAGTTELALQRLNARGGRVEMPCKQLFENVYGHGFHSIAVRDGSGRVVLG